MSNKDRIAELETLINEAAHQYYNEEPLMTDAEFDSLCDELRKLAPKSQALKQIGAKPTSVWPEVHHETAMGSQFKADSIEEFLAWAKKTGAKTFCWSEKLDGSSLALKYNKGVLIQALSRGDGVTGSDLTPNVAQMKVLSSIKATEKIWVRSEVIMKKSTFDEKYKGKINEESGHTFKNPRNTAAGLARRFSGVGCDDLGVIAYGVDGVELTTEMQKFDWLEQAGFFTPAWGIVTAEEVEQVYRRYIESDRNSCPFEIDGLIIAVNDIAAQKALGVTDNRPKGQIALKFPSLQVESILEQVIWQTGRTGRICPVALISPVEVGGVTISRVTLDNCGIIQALNLELGCRIVVERRNDVIPKIVRRL